MTFLMKVSRHFRAIQGVAPQDPRMFHLHKGGSHLESTSQEKI